MPWEIVPVGLSLIAVVVVVTLLLTALNTLLDPPPFVRCDHCHRWTIDTRRGPEKLCFRCREHQHTHVASTPFRWARR